MVFTFLVIVVAIILWFLLSPTFRPFGSIIVKMFNNVKNEMSDAETGDTIERKDDSNE